MANTSLLQRSGRHRKATKSGASAEMNSLEVKYKRQMGIFNPLVYGKTSVTLVGAGGIGSWTALALSKIGLSSVHVYDGDRISVHNQPAQYFPGWAVGKYKTDVLEENLDGVVGFNEFVGDSFVGSSLITIAAVDSNTSRRHIWDWALRDYACRWYFDGRLGGQTAMLYTVDMESVDQMARYEETLHSDEERTVVPCAESAVIDVAFTIAAMITRGVRLALTAGESTFQRVVCQRTGSTMEVK